MKLARKLIFLISIIIILLGISTPAYAYLDPSTGSAILQGLLAGIAGALAALKLYWQRVKHFFCTIKRYFSSNSTKNKNKNDDKSSS